MPTSFTPIAIIGAGTMGAKIAHRCAVSGLETRLYDKYARALENAMARIGDWLQAQTDHDLIGSPQATAARDRLQVCSTLPEAVARARLVIETVPENLELKRRVLALIDPLLPPQALICTNSSALPCSRMADVLSHPERFFNINFSDPQDPADRLVELMRGKQTTTATLAAGQEFVRALGMVPIVTRREIMGFSFNRIWRAVKKEALYLADHGYCDPEDIDRAWMLDFQTPWGPFGLMDMVGLDVVRDIENLYFKESGDEGDKPPQLLETMIRQGRLGEKSGRGFYTYPDPAYEHPDWLTKSGQFSE